MTELPFDLNIYGEFLFSQLQIIFDGSPLYSDPKLNQLVEETWARVKSESIEHGVNLFDGHLFKHLGHKHINNNLYIYVGLTSYSKYIGTNYTNPQLGDEFGWEQYSNPLGASANIITSDGWLIYGRRSKSVFTHRGYVHAFGGGLSLDDLGKDGFVDAYAGITRELSEELKLMAKDINQLICIGVISAQTTRQPEIIFDCYTNCTKDDLLQRVELSDFESEHVSIEFCCDNQKSVADFVINTRPIASVAVGAACLHGKRQFGDAWYGSTIRKIVIDLSSRGEEK